MLTIAAMLSGAWAFLKAALVGLCSLRHLFDDSVLSLSLLVCLAAPSCYMDMRHEAAQRRRKFQHPEGDYFTLINIYNAFKRSQTQQCNRST